MTLLIYEVGDIVRKHTHFPAPRLGLPGSSGDEESVSNGILNLDDDEEYDATYSIDKLIELIEETVAPGTWGGNPNSITHYGSRLFIKTAASTHSSIAGTLAKVRRRAPDVELAVRSQWVTVSDESLATLPKSTTSTPGRRYRTLTHSDSLDWIESHARQNDHAQRKDASRTGNSDTESVASEAITNASSDWIDLTERVSAHLPVAPFVNTLQPRQTVPLKSNPAASDSSESVKLPQIEVELKAQALSGGKTKLTWKIVRRLSDKTRVLARGRAKVSEGESIVITDCGLEPDEKGRRPVLILEQRPEPSPESD